MKGRILALLMLILKESTVDVDGDEYVFTYSIDSQNTVQLRISEDLFFEFYNSSIKNNRLK